MSKLFYKAPTASPSSHWGVVRGWAGPTQPCDRVVLECSEIKCTFNFHVVSLKIIRQLLKLNCENISCETTIRVAAGFLNVGISCAR